MPAAEVIVLNERQVPPRLGHENALIWSFFRSSGAANVSPPESSCLQKMTGFVEHGLQGRKNTDHHSHANIEQVYYILDGRTEVLIGEEKYPVQPDDVVYLPPTVPHQNLNENSDDWVFLLILSCPAESTGTKPAIRNWRDQSPEKEGEYVVKWSLLKPLGHQGGPEEGARLLGLNEVCYLAIQQGQASGACCTGSEEHLLYVTGGAGKLLLEDRQVPVEEDSAIYVPPRTEYRLLNEDRQEWLTLARFAAEVESDPAG